jgi:PKD repeat protein
VATVPPTGNAGDTLRFSARPASEVEPILEYTWDFGDGTSVSGANVAHAFTHAGTYQVRVHASGLAASSSDQSKSLTIHGAVFTKYAPGAKRRLEATRP